MNATVAENGILALLVLATVIGAWGYLARITMPRPPIGVITWGDVLAAMIGLVVMPFAYLHIPVAVVSTLFGLVAFALSQTALSPLLGGRRAVVASLLLCGGDIAAWRAAPHPLLPAVDGAVLILIVIGTTNLWTQAGMKPKHVAGLAAALTVYDTLATGLSSTTLDFLTKVSDLPFAPMLSVRGGHPPLGYGLGDCIMLALWPLVAARGYGRSAAVAAIAFDALVMCAVQLCQLAGLIDGPFPLQTVLGPVIIAQFAWWRAHGRTA